VRILYRPHQYSQQRQKEKKRWIYPVLLAMQAEYYRKLGHTVYWDYPMPCDKVVTEPEDIDFLKIPAPDRHFSNAFDSRYMMNGNFKYLPATYIQVANGCWYGKCAFCVEKKNVWKVRQVLDVHEELKEIKAIGFKEVFDDSGTFPMGHWLEEFLGMENPGIVMGCNMRMIEAPWRRMKHWGFRMVLFGLESANQRTLDRIHKGVRVEDIKHIEDAAKAGLDPHVAVMFGYPWETERDAKKTLQTVHYLLKNGYAKTAQASFYQNPLHDSNEGHRRFVRGIYDVALSPRFWINKIIDIKNTDDLSYLWRQIREGLRWKK
jgi:radical SAM superfamily enzyme YgiQ (UPF0313 family)